LLQVFSGAGSYTAGGAGRRLRRISSWRKAAPTGIYQGGEPMSDNAFMPCCRYSPALRLPARGLLLTLLLICGDGQQNQALAATLVLEQPLQITFPAVNEMSGIVKSRRFDNVYWVHNDSGDQPRLFALDNNARIIFPGFLRRDFHGETVAPGKRPWPGHEIHVAANVDWEDIAVDDDMLYIADMGNNGNARRDLGVYVVPEPNPRAVELTRPIAFLPVRYPEQDSWPASQWHYDSEALFVADHQLYFITKHRQPGKIDKFEAGAMLYRLDTRFTDKYNDLVKVDQHDLLAVATGADLSPDGRLLAVVTYQDLWLFEKPAAGDQWLSSQAYRLALDRSQIKQVEAITWIDDDTLLLGNEEGQLYQVKRSSVPALVKPQQK
jgi:hypothetical protein